MNKTEQVVIDTGLEEPVEAIQSEPIVELEPKMLAGVAGGPDGSVIGVA